MKQQFDDRIVRALCSGSAAGLAMASAASTGALRAGHASYAALNAVTHCLWPDASSQETPSIKYTALGATIHMGSALVLGRSVRIAVRTTEPSRRHRERCGGDRAHRLCSRLPRGSETLHAGIRSACVDAFAGDGLCRAGCGVRHSRVGATRGPLTRRYALPPGMREKLTKDERTRRPDWPVGREAGRSLIWLRR